MRRYLMVITGAFEIGGGIAAVNRLVMKAIDSHHGTDYQLDVLSLLEDGNPLDPHYVKPSHVRYRCFADNRVSFVLSLWRKLLTVRYEWVYCDTINLAAALALLTFTRLFRYIVCLYGIEVFSPLPDWEGELGLRKAWKRLVISEFTRDRVLERYPQLQLTLCEPSLDPIRYDTSTIVMEQSTQRSLTLKAVDSSLRLLGAQVILHVGRMAVGDRYKGQDVLIRAMPGILKEFPYAQLVLAGHGDDMPRLLTLSRSMPEEVQSAIFLPGYLPDAELDELNRHCYLFAMPSRGEGFGLVYLEAMRWAKACIGSRIDAAQSVIRHEETGLLVDDPSSPEEVGQAIKRLLRNRDATIKMGQAGYDLVQQRYLFSHFEERFRRAVEK